MPGTIMVSVLEFIDLPLSSSTSIKASMGKIEYQIIDKGNFTFPLTSLRDDLILKIQDNEGNEISRAGIHVRLILEKGVWEDMFPIGGGHLHLKLQVVLSDEARDRIRTMRQSALKKKHDELLRSSRRDAESDSSTTIIGNAELPFQTSNEVSVLHLLKNHQSNNTFNLKQFRDYKVRLVYAMPKKLTLEKIADQYKETSSTKPVSQQVPTNLIQLQHKGKEPANHSPFEKDSQRVTGSKEIVVFLGSKQNNVLTNNPIKHNQEDALEYTEKKRPPRRIPSNVRKMISAFETSLAQDMRPHIKPPPTQYEATDMTDSSETQHLEQVAYNRNQEEEKNKRDLMRTSKFEMATVSGKMPLEHSDKNPPSESSYELVIQRDSPQKLDSVVQLDNKCSSFESSGAWTFPEEFRKICITTSGKSVMDLVESQDTKRPRHQRMDFTKIENTEKNAAYVGTGIEGSKYERIQKIDESKTNTSDNNGDENSEGPFNQVIKGAIIIGFGLLVLLTRQRKKRVKDKTG